MVVPNENQLTPVETSALELKPAESEHHLGEAEILVSEFPPPPSYFSLAVNGLLEPPSIPVEALKNAAKKASALVAEAERAAEAERFASLGIASQSLAPASHQSSLSDTNDAAKLSSTAQTGEEITEGDVVAVFSEILEDPLLFQVKDDCENPALVRDRLKQ